MWKKYIYNEKETDYSISTEGEVRKDSTNHMLSQSTQQQYKFVTLILEDKKQKRMRVHRLVAETFIPNPDNKPYVNHKDGNRSNNNVENLEWVTPSENTQHAFKTGLIKPGRGRQVTQYDLQGNEMMTFSSLTEAARETNSNQAKITLCCQKLYLSKFIQGKKLLNAMKKAIYLIYIIVLKKLQEQLMALLPQLVEYVVELI